MLRYLFPRLTAKAKRGQALFDLAVSEARQPHWYGESEVPDSIDGRFAMLATICALLVVRLESGGTSGEAASAALTERFIEAMDAEHRELGLNDPGLGRKVRKLVGALARRVDLWRPVAEGDGDWSEAALSSVYLDRTPSPDTLVGTGDALREFWGGLARAADGQLMEGRI